jgi:uncharacterized protein
LRFHAGVPQTEAMMRKLLLSCGLLAGTVALLAQSPSTRVRAQENPAGQVPPQTKAKSPDATASKTDPAKETQIRQLMDVTGVNGLGEQLMNAGIAQFRANVTESQPDNPRAKQFADAFAARFQKHFDPQSVTETVIPIYDKYLSNEDVKALLDYYKSPFGQKMLKVLPEVARDSQTAGYALGQKAAEEAMDDLRAEYPEFVPATKEEEKRPGQ